LASRTLYKGLAASAAITTSSNAASFKGFIFAILLPIANSALLPNFFTSRVAIKNHHNYNGLGVLCCFFSLLFLCFLLLVIKQ
jgi:hypothetical protein